RAGERERREHGLEDERRAPGAADLEGVLARPHRAGAERELLRTHVRPGRRRARDLDGGANRREVLAHEARPLAPRADLLDPERRPGDERRRERRAQDLSAALADRAVDRESGLGRLHDLRSSPSPPNCRRLFPSTLLSRTSLEGITPSRTRP